MACRIFFKYSAANPSIPDEERDALLDSNLSAKTFGTGLGLPMARKIMEAHNGRIEIKVNEGGGNTVELYLPTV